MGAITGLAAAGGIVAWLLRMSSGVYRGPVSDHFDGEHFIGPYAVRGNGTLAFWRWQFTRDKAKWPDWVDNKPSNKPPARVTDSARFTFIGHASFLLQTGGLNILIDPVWSDRASPVSFAGPKRVRAPGIAFDDLPKIDAVLITHGHYDHLDMTTLERIAARDGPRIVTPLGHGHTIYRFSPSMRAEPHDWGERVALNGEVAVTLAPAKHWTARGLFDRNRALWASYVIETPAGKIYHVTDTGYGDGSLFREARDKYGPFRLAVIPIGAYDPRWFMREQHVNPEDAVNIFRDCGAHQALAHHFGTFQLTDEAFDAPVAELRAACAAQGIAADQFRAPEPGDVLEI
jgi:L-ascorbate metabolism protein UlaG (beta-lactamase superfamily)